MREVSHCQQSLGQILLLFTIINIINDREHPRSFCVLLLIATFKTRIFQNKYSTDEKTKAQKGQITCSGSPSV